MTALLLSSLNLNNIVNSWFMKIYWSTNNISYEEGKIWRKWRKQILSFVSSDYENKPGVDSVLVILISVSDYWHRCRFWPQEKSIFTNCNKNLTVSGLNLFELILRLCFRIFRELFDPIVMLYGKNYFFPFQNIHQWLLVRCCSCLLKINDSGRWQCETGGYWQVSHVDCKSL